MTIETKKVASVNEAINIINRLNYTNETFHYKNSTFSDDYKVEYRFCDGVRDNGLYSGMSIIEIVTDGTLQTVRFFNHFCDITVDLRIGDFVPDYDRFDTVINVDTVDTEDANTSAEETVNVENLTVNQKLAAQIVAKIGNLIVKCDSGEYGTRKGQVISYDTYVDKKDEFGTNLHFREVFTDEDSFILDHVNLINGYDENKTVETFYFTKPETTAEKSAPVDDFEAKIAELKSNVDAAQADYDAKSAERQRLQAAVEDAKIEENILYENLRVATSEFDRFGDAKARELRENLITGEILATRDLIIYNQTGSVYLPALKNLGVWFINGKFEFHCDKEASNIIYHFATYDTPAQVKRVINRLKFAIECGDKEFQFPTIDELKNSTHGKGTRKRRCYLEHLERLATHLWDKIQRESKPLDDDNVANLLPKVDELNDVQVDEPIIIAKFEAGKDYLLHAHTATRRPLIRKFKVLNHGKVYLTIAEYNRFGTLSSAERCKITNNGKSEYVIVFNIDNGLYYELYAKDVANEPPAPYKPQCSWNNPHNYGEPGNLNFDPNDRLRAYRNSIDELNNPTSEPPAPYKPLCSWNNPHNYGDPGNLNFDPNDRLRAYQDTVDDKLIRAMRDTLLRVQAACKSHDINAALYELKLFAICRDAHKVESEKEFTPTPKRDRQSNDAASYEEIEAKAVKYDDAVKDLEEQIATVEDECAFNQVCYDEPDDSRERIHFDAELKKLIDRGLRLIKKRDKLATHRDRLYLTIEKLDAQAI